MRRRVILLGGASLCIPTVVSAGVISNAPSFSTILLRVFDFLLSLVGILAIIGLVISGLMYITAFGDRKKIDLAKKVMVACITGVGVALAALIVIAQVQKLLGA